MKTPLLRYVILLLVAGVIAFVGCSDGYPQPASATNRLVVTLAPTTDAGSEASPLPLSFTDPQTYTLTIKAETIDGSIDTSFNGFVRASVVPGTVLSVTGPRTSGRNVQLSNGVAENVQISVLGVYGDARIWIEDIGYIPADPTDHQPPQCADGKDNNHNGLVDFPVDPGCAYANDNSEDGGTFATGISNILYYVYPRIADVRGVAQGGAATPFPNEQVQMDTQFSNPVPTPLVPLTCVPIDPTTNLPLKPGPGMTLAQEYASRCTGIDRIPRGVVSTGLSSSGFYATDVADPRGYSSVFAYNYTAPPTMRVCDRLIAFGGTSSDFYGFTEINYPAWELDEWDPTTRDCFVPEPHVFTTGELGSTPGRLAQESALVRVMRNSLFNGPSAVPYPMSDSLCNDPCPDPKKPNPSPLGSSDYTVHIGALIGPGHPDPKQNYAPTADATNCDYNGDGKVEFTPTTGPEALCANACEAQVECSEYSNYIAQTQFNLVVVYTSSGSATKAVVLADGSASQTFDPVLNKGKDIGSFTGNLKYFSGGTQFTVVARCDDDIVLDITQPPLPSDKACVSARLIPDQTF